MSRLNDANSIINQLGSRLNEAVVEINELKDSTKQHFFSTSIEL